MAAGTWVLRAARVVTPARTLTPGWLAVDGERITDVGVGRPPAVDTVIDVGERVVAPGFIDLHVHGGAGAQVNAATADLVTESVFTLAAFHATHGTTALLATTVSDTPDALAVALEGVAAAARRRPEGAAVLGSHAEGPWLAPGKAGAQDPRCLRPPDIDELHRLVRASRGTLRLLTVAPERPGGLGLVSAAAAEDVVVSVGHTEADYDTARAAFDAGARHVTHLFNAMPPVHHRSPGPVVAALQDPRVTVEVVGDGHHVHPAVIRMVSDLAGDRVVAVTDAVSAAGLPDGRYRVGTLDVTLRADRVSLADDDATLAGSVLTLDRALRLLVAEAGMAVDAALTALTVTPAGVIGADDRGRVDAGFRADVVVLEPDLSVAATLVGGRVVHDAVGVFAPLGSSP